MIHWDCPERTAASSAEFLVLLRSTNRLLHDPGPNLGLLFESLNLVLVEPCALNNGIFCQ